MHMEKSIYSHDYSILLEQLRKARKDRGLTQADVAEYLGQTQSFVSKVERRERRLDVVELRAYCSAIGEDFPDFMQRIETLLANHKSDRPKLPVKKSK